MSAATHAKRSSRFGRKAAYCFAWKAVVRREILRGRCLEEKVDLWVEGIEAYNRGDIEAVLGAMDPDIKFEHRLAALQGKFAVIEAVRNRTLDARGYLVDSQIDCSDVRDLGRLRVLRAWHHSSHREGSRHARQNCRYTVLATHPGWANHALHRLRRQSEGGTQKPPGRRSSCFGESSTRCSPEILHRHVEGERRVAATRVSRPWNRRDLDGYVDLLTQRSSGTRVLREWKAVHSGAARG